MKRKLILIFCLVNLIACMPKNNGNVDQFMVGIVKTSSNTKDSVISFYDEKLKNIKAINCSAGELGTNFSQAVYLNDKAYVIPRGVTGHYDDKKVVEINMNKFSINEYSIDRINLQKIGVTNDNLFVISNLNFINYLTKIDKNSKVLKEITSNNFMELVVCTSNRVILFESNESLSFIKVYSEELELLKTIDITQIGSQHSKYAIYGNYLIFSNAYVKDIPNNTISILDLNSYKIRNIELNYLYPNDILIFNDRLIISHTSDVEPRGTMLSIVNLNDFSISSEVELDNQIMRIELYENKLFVLSPKNNENISKLTVYDLENNFKQINQLELVLQDNEYLSCLFVKQN